MCDKSLTTTSTGTSGEVGDSGAKLRPCLTVVHHRDPDCLGLRVVLAAGEPLELGRGKASLGPGVLDDSKISRQHAVVHCDRDGTVVVRDAGSHNGTLINGERVDQAILAPHDVIGIGSLLLLYHLAPPAYRVRRHERIVGVGYAVAHLLQQIERVASHRTTVLVLGESGTGKELVAQELHERSGRTGKFLPFNCGGVNDGVLQSELFGCVRGAYSGADRDRAGLIEAADGGTLFLDEIGDASEVLQTSLLRVLQEGAVRRVGGTRSSRSTLVS